ncbi:MAG: tRNA (adenosine(37)-N6)-threonylcarbamoyltransferase complex dimerization subunit type 1 TsaB [Massilia sp.]
MPIILAIETSSELASCALHRGAGAAVIARESSGVRTHSQSILPMVQEVLAEAGIALRDCDAIAFGAGPGSFTGVRTACGIAQGLAFGAGLPVLAVNTLAAMALACHQQTGATCVLPVLDARMGEVYWAQYRFDATADGNWVVLAEAALCAPEAVTPVARPFTACGNGLGAYPQAYAGEEFAGALPAIMPHAAQVAELAQAELAAGRGVSAAEAQPLYLRNKIAFTSAERLVINAAKAAA